MWPNELFHWIQVLQEINLQFKDQINEFKDQ